MDYLAEGAVMWRAWRLAAGLLLPACSLTHAPLGPVPEPLPETLAWETSAADDGAFLGLKTEENSVGSLDDLQFLPGVRIVRVVENSPAAAAGLAAGDVLLKLAGQTVDDPGTLDALVLRASPGSRVELSVQRGDTVFAVPVVLAAAEASSATPAQVLYRLDPKFTRAGWATHPHGVALVSLAADSPLADAGVPLGSVVSRVDGQPAHSDRGLLRLLAGRGAGAEVRLDLNTPDGTRRELTLSLYEPPTRLTSLSVPVLFAYESDAAGMRSSLSVVDLWIVQLFRTTRDNGERRYVLLELFGWEVFTLGFGVGELAE
ncbi:MAG: PDZ domain-containing protein [Planctomycetota bacterium]